MTEKSITEAQALTNATLEVISQGAEAVVFQTNMHPYIKTPYFSNKSQYVVKYRPAKKYRHPKIDASITRSRTAGEIKFMAKLAKAGVNAPGLIVADVDQGIIWMEYLGRQLDDGQVSSVKNEFWWLEKNAIDQCLSEKVKQMCIKVGKLIGQLHDQDMIHGDLTTSNIIIHENEPYLIDFGLSSYSGLAEDKAVDLYVLERAVDSTHSDYAKEYNEWIREGYGEGKKAKEVMRRLDEVRMRGRKRSMLG